MDNSRIPEKYWLENSVAEDLWEDHDRNGNITLEGTEDRDILRRNVEMARAWLGAIAVLKKK